jgi:hypothetical protein
MNKHRDPPSTPPMKRLLLAAVFLPSLLLAQSPPPQPTPPVPAATDFATEMMGATFKFGGASCFLVRRAAPDTAVYLVTTAHSIGPPPGDTGVLVLRKSKPDGSYERHEHTVTIRRDGKPLWVRHEKQDVMVLRLEAPLPVPVAALPVSALADETRLKAAAVHLCSPLFALGYPKQLEADASGLPVARQGIFASPPLLPWRTHPNFLADFKAFGGDSGGPVFIAGPDNHPLVVGIVTDQLYFDEVWEGMYLEQRIRTPLGVVKILHAQYIRDTLEAAVK